MKELHIGNLIKSKLLEDGRSIVWLANNMNCSRDNIYKMLRKQHLDCDVLLKISVIMNYNFFELYSRLFKKLQKEGYSKIKNMISDEKSNN